MSNYPEEEVEIGRGFAITTVLLLFLLLIGFTTLAAGMTLTLAWLTNVFIPLPFWQMVVAVSLLFLGTTILIHHVRPYANFGNILWIVGTLLILLVISVIVAWLMTLVTPLATTHTFAPAAIVTLTVIWYVYRAVDEMVFGAYEEESAILADERVMEDLRKVYILEPEERPAKKRKPRSGKGDRK